MNTDIETKLRQGPEVDVTFPDLDGLLPVKTILFHRTDYHEDDSKSEYYGIELTEEQFKLVKKNCTPPRPKTTPGSRWQK